MKADLIVYNARQLVTCASGGKPKKGASMRDPGIIENGAAAITNGRIISVGKSDEILREFQSDEVIDARQKVVCPGFVECHTHLVYAGDRLDEFELKIKGADYLEILKSGGGILSTVEATREASLDGLIAQARNRLDKMLALGVTTCEIKTGYGLSTESELKLLTAILELDQTHPIDIVPTLLAAHAVPHEFKENPDEYVDLVCNEMLHPAAAILAHNFVTQQENKKAPYDVAKSYRFNLKSNPSEFWKFVKKDMFVDVFCERNAFDLEQSRRVLETAKSLGYKIKAHVDEFTNLGGTRMAIELGATSIGHLDAISDEEIKLLAEFDTIGVVTPTVNFNFGAKEFADARKMIDAGCALAVSTDFNPGSAPCPSLPNAMAIACRYQKLLPSEVLNAATINAAFAVGAGDKVGSIETGKKADLLILDTNDYRQLAYEFGGNSVDTIIKNGELVMT